MYKDLAKDIQEYTMKDRCINKQEYELLMKKLNATQNVMLRAMPEVSFALTDNEVD